LGSEKRGAQGIANGDVVMWQSKKQSTVELRGTERSEKKESRQESQGVRREVLKSRRKSENWTWWRRKDNHND